MSLLTQKREGVFHDVLIPSTHLVSSEMVPTYQWLNVHSYAYHLTCLYHALMPWAHKARFPLLPLETPPLPVYSLQQNVFLYFAFSA